MTIESNETTNATLASYLAAAFRRPETRADDVARAMGHLDSSFLLEVAKGARRLPLETAPDLACTLAVDRLWLLALAMRDYSPSLASCLASYCVAEPASQS